MYHQVGQQFVVVGGGCIDIVVDIVGVVAVVGVAAGSDVIVHGTAGAVEQQRGYRWRSAGALMTP